MWRIWIAEPTSVAAQSLSGFSKTLIYSSPICKLQLAQLVKQWAKH